MPDRIRGLEERLGRLEAQVLQLKSDLGNDGGARWWERSAGLFEGDPLFEDIVRECRRLRREEYRAARTEAPAKPNRRRKGASRGRVG